MSGKEHFQELMDKAFKAFILFCFDVEDIERRPLETSNKLRRHVM